ncbi:MAG: DNA-directed RNA polymerase subunit alpha [Elusimicrobia bacterium CG08_land_8_20_14_0_20_44_26]|nr:MAG: DNA-directed RNA polymerase subunit alpha [Elusimicrobia bacterium CG08_land_8_20_14_0_20_44_26]
MQEFIIPEGFVKDESGASDVFARFSIAPFEKGFGYTFGNSLRRILLSSIPGCAVSGIKMEGAMHEFSSIFAVKEDVVEIVLNFKKLCFGMTGDERMILTLMTSKKGPVCGKDVKLPTGVTLANPDQYLFTLDKPKKMRVDIEVTKGIGYVAVENRADPVDVGFIAIDADYSPVKKVSYHVENTRVKRITNYDKLIIEITTDGTVLPEDALKKSAEILKKCAEVFVRPAEDKEKETGDGIARVKSTEIMDQSIEVLGIPTRILNSLRSKKIATLADLTKFNEAELGTFPNFGPKSLIELKKALKTFSKKEGVEVHLL